MFEYKNTYTHIFALIFCTVLHYGYFTLRSVFVTTFYKIHHDYLNDLWPMIFGQLCMINLNVVLIDVLKCPNATCSFHFNDCFLAYKQYFTSIIRKVLESHFFPHISGCWVMVLCIMSIWRTEFKLRWKNNATPLYQFVNMVCQNFPGKNFIYNFLRSRTIFLLSQHSLILTQGKLKLKCCSFVRKT